MELFGRFCARDAAQFRDRRSEQQPLRRAGCSLSLPSVHREQLPSPAGRTPLPSRWMRSRRVPHGSVKPSQNPIARFSSGTCNIRIVDTPRDDSISANRSTVVMVPQWSTQGLPTPCSVSTVIHKQEARSPPKRIERPLCSLQGGRGPAAFEKGRCSPSAWRIQDRRRRRLPTGLLFQNKLRLVLTVADDEQAASWTVARHGRMLRAPVRRHGSRAPSGASSRCRTATTVACGPRSQGQSTVA